MRILLVDRDDGFRFAVRTLLRRLHVGDILSTGKAAPARDLTHRLAYDLAVVELAEAMDFVRWLRGSPASPAPGLPLLALAESADDYRIALVRRLGVQGVLVKPVAAEALVAAMAEVLAVPRTLEGPGEADAPVAPPRPPVPRRRGKGGGASGVPASGGVPAIVPDNLAASGPSSPAGFVELAAPAPTGTPGEWGAPADDGPAASGRLSPPSGPPAHEAPNPGSAAGDSASSSLEALLADHAEWVASAAARGARADLSDRDLEGVSWPGQMLANARMVGAVLAGADLAEAQMHGADLRRAELMGTVLTKANLAVARLRHARLGGARLEGANLKGADLSGADLSGAGFGDADLSGAILVGADLAGADLGAVRGLVQSQVDGALCDGGTRLPPGLFPPRRENDAG